MKLFFSLCVLSGHLILRKLLQNPSATGVVILFVINLSGTLSSRSKDQVSRVHSNLIASMLKFGLYNKSLHLSAKSQLEFPAGTIINLSSHDVAFLCDYFLKVHDIWSAISQRIIIIVIITWIMGSPSVIGQSTFLYVWLTTS